ncbi:hypothetical protein GIB67_026314, partial [Kingdonia uniflora]
MSSHFAHLLHTLPSCKPSHILHNFQLIFYTRSIFCDLRPNQFKRRIYPSLFCPFLN